MEIYRRLRADVEAGDGHSAAVAANRVGILNGAKYKRLDGTITIEQEQEITAIVSTAEVSVFRPLLYVIPFSKVKKVLKEVPVGDRAHPLSIEYRIEKLPRRCFDVIEVEGGFHV